MQHLIRRWKHLISLGIKNMFIDQQNILNQDKYKVKTNVCFFFAQLSPITSLYQCTKCLNYKYMYVVYCIY